MTNFYATARARRGVQYDALVADQAKHLGIEEARLRDLDTALQLLKTKHAHIVADQPAPARGYATVYFISDTSAGVQLHVLEGQPREVHRALFSATYVQAKRIVPGLEVIFVDQAQTAPYLHSIIEDEGKRYALDLYNVTEWDGKPQTSGAETEGEPEIVEDALSAALASDPEPVEAEPAHEEEAPDIVEEAPEQVEEVEEVLDTDLEPLLSEDSDDEEDLPPLEPVEFEEHLCEVPGCGRTFSSERGLQVHTARHKSASAE